MATGHFYIQNKFKSSFSPVAARAYVRKRTDRVVNCLNTGPHIEQRRAACHNPSPITMTPQTISPPPWNTATCGGPVTTSPLDLSTLGEHLNACQVMHRHWFALHCATETLRGFVAARLVTTVLTGLLIVGVSGWFF